MPGLGVRLWHPSYRANEAEVFGTVVNTTVFDAIGLEGLSIPFKSLTGNILLRMVGRANKATRPIPFTVTWDNKPMTQKSLFVQSGDGGTFVGIWCMTGVAPADGHVFISCGTGFAGCAAIRVGELAGAPMPVISAAKAGYDFNYAMTASAILVAGGTANADAFPFTSSDFEMQYGVKIPPKVDLPNRHNGLSAFFGVTYSDAVDGNYAIAPATSIAGVIGAIEISI